MQQVIRQGRVQVRPAPLRDRGGSGTGQTEDGGNPVPRQHWSVGCCTAHFRLCHCCSPIFQGAVRSFVSLPYSLSQKDIKC